MLVLVVDYILKIMNKFVVTEVLLVHCHMFNFTVYYTLLSISVTVFVFV